MSSTLLLDGGGGSVQLEYGSSSGDPLRTNAGQQRLASPAAAFNNTVKCILGTGVVALPWAVASAGWAAGIVGLLAIAALNAVTMRQFIFIQACVREDRLRRDPGATTRWSAYSRSHHILAPSPGDSDREITPRDIGFLACGKPGMYGHKTVSSAGTNIGVVSPRRVLTETAINLGQTV